MSLSTEIFVMIIFIAGAPFFYFILKDSDLGGRVFFMRAFIFLVFSNICTVVENFWMYAFFNIIEHVFITLASIMMLVAVYQMTARIKQDSISRIANEVKD